MDNRTLTDHMRHSLASQALEINGYHGEALLVQARYQKILTTYCTKEWRPHFCDTLKQQ